MARKPIKFLSHEMQLAVLFVNDYYRVFCKKSGCYQNYFVAINNGGTL